MSEGDKRSPGAGLRVAVLGCGSVGSQVVRLLQEQASDLAARVGAPVDLVGVAVPGTGAYCRSMASNYNHALRPPVVAVRDGVARVLVRRETEDDLLATDMGDAS